MTAHPDPANTPAPEDPALDEAAARVIVDCDGDAGAAVRVLVVAVAHLESELRAERALSATLAEAVSRGYVRGRRYRNLERAETPIPYTPDS
jgi:hypothetical protein